MLLDHMDWLSSLSCPHSGRMAGHCQSGRANAQDAMASAGNSSAFIDRVEVDFSTPAHRRLALVQPATSKCLASTRPRSYVGQLLHRQFGGIKRIELSTDGKLLRRASLPTAHPLASAADADSWQHALQRLESFKGKTTATTTFVPNSSGREQLYRELPVPTADVNDMGGGTGSNLESLGDRISQLSEVFLVDLSPSLDVARERPLIAGRTCGFLGQRHQL